MLLTPALGLGVGTCGRLSRIANINAFDPYPEMMLKH